MRFLRIGTTIVTADRAHKRTGLERSVTLTGDDAAAFLRVVDALAEPWRPSPAPGPRPALPPARPAQPD